MAATGADSSSSQQARLAAFSACEITDALLMIEQAQDPARTPKYAGYLADIRPLPQHPPPKHRRLVAPAHPVVVGPLDMPSATSFPEGSVWSDECPPAHLVLLVQPVGARCAAIGGLHAARLRHRGCAGVVVAGRARDRGELLASAAAGVLDATTTKEEEEEVFAVWAAGTSVVGAGAEGHVVAVGGEVDVQGVTVAAGDWLLCDFDEEAVVRVPRGITEAVLAVAAERKARDARVEEFVRAGGRMGEGFLKFRGKIDVLGHLERNG